MAASVPAALTPAKAPAPPGPDGSRQWALTKQYCVVCHNQKLSSGGVSLATLDASNVTGNADVLERVLRKLRSGEMPPAGMPRPDGATMAGFTHWLEGELDQAAAAHPNPGHPTIHRLNRAEYSNAVRDLLAVDIQPGSMLPVDDTGYGFDNIGDVLSLSPVLIERYISVARMVSRVAVGDAGAKPEVAEFRPPKGLQRTGPRLSERAGDDLPVQLGRRPVGALPISSWTPSMSSRSSWRLQPASTVRRTARSFDLRLPVKAGTRTVAVTFPRQEAMPETLPHADDARNGAGNAPSAIRRSRICGSTERG